MTRRTPLLLVLALLAALAPWLGSTAASAADEPAPDVELVGVVRDTSGAPVPGATVSLYSREVDSWWGLVEDPVTTGPDGSFEFPEQRVRAYRFSVAADGFLAEFHPDADNVESGDDVLGVPGRTEVAITLEPAAQSLGGRTTSLGEPAAGVRVEVELQRPDQGWRHYAYVLTGVDGTYRLGVAEGTYRLRFLRAGLVPEWYADVPTVYEAARVVVAAGATVVVDAELAPSRSVIQGRVLVNGKPFVPASDDQLLVVIAEREHVSGDFHYTGTDGEGNYSLPYLPADRYRLSAFVNTEGSGVTREWFDDAATQQEAIWIELDGTSSFVADFDLEGSPPPPASEPLSGRTTDLRGAPAPGVIVTVEERAVGETSWTSLPGIATANDGGWTAATQQGHRYRVSFRHPGFRTQWYRNARRAADATIVAPGATGVDARLRPSPWWQQALPWTCRLVPVAAGCGS
ncbi:carboxypeptidase regulatory-like domain-containing protein [Nocardioides sp. 616]|uniref:carboxypeptidase regulatory-like domain-containing protein n=1 Tax=Nocardioides sp. 616 TaxID=2268090 RepID=UPI0013B38727|nr:carboxypeptidase regulatory-like domain-containing protein [Nocardioides sp. 616]